MAEPIHFRPATAWDAEQLAGTMRPADVAESAAFCGFSPIEALLVSMRVSTASFSLVLDGEVAAIFGWVEVPGSLTTGVKAQLWMLSGAAVDKKPKAFWRASRKAVAELARQFQSLTCWVDVRYTASLRWLTRLGFRMSVSDPYISPSGDAFLPLFLWSTTWAS